jgi:Flp pilus assembly protein CpaB
MQTARWTIPLVMLAVVIHSANAVPGPPCPPEMPIERTYPVTLEGTCSGFCSLPGSQVDIIATFRLAGGGGYSKLVAENVRVVACHYRLDADGELATPRQLVRLRLLPRQAADLDQARSDCAILSLSLRCQEPDEPRKVVFGHELRPRGDQRDLWSRVQEWASGLPNLLP